MYIQRWQTERISKVTECIGTERIYIKINECGFREHFYRFCTQKYQTFAYIFGFRISGKDGTERNRPTIFDYYTVCTNCAIWI